jgi:hypothetical protein
MIKVDHIEVFGWEGAIRGMRNPLNSWDKSDSCKCEAHVNGDCLHVFEGTNPAIECHNGAFGFCIGEADLALMRKLCRAGSDHRKFLRQIMVSMDITAPLYWWKEFDTYKVGTVANSCSTMHTIHKRDLTVDDFSHERLIPHALKHLKSTISEINGYRNVFVNWDTQSRGIQEVFDFKRENAWYQIIQLLPTSYNQMRTVTLDYEVLFNVYHARRNHRLDEWHVLCDAIEKMPYFSKICLEETT